MAAPGLFLISAMVSPSIAVYRSGESAREQRLAAAELV
jgi:hypothetical protein